MISLSLFSSGVCEAVCSSVQVQFLGISSWPELPFPCPNNGGNFLVLSHHFLSGLITPSLVTVSIPKGTGNPPLGNATCQVTGAESWRIERWRLYLYKCDEWSQSGGEEELFSYLRSLWENCDHMGFFPFISVPVVYLVIFTALAHH